LIVVDTLSDEGNKGRLCSRRLSDMSAMITADMSRPCVVFAHHPPFDVTVAPEPFQFEMRAEADAMLAGLARHSHVAGLFCGHIHRAFETSFGSLRACVVSSVSSDVRWDKELYPDASVPVLRTYDIGSSASANPVVSANVVS
jgi:hypothetical protein